MRLRNEASYPRTQSLDGPYHVIDDVLLPGPGLLDSLAYDQVFLIMSLLKRLDTDNSGYTYVETNFYHLYTQLAEYGQGIRPSRWSQVSTDQNQFSLFT